MKKVLVVALLTLSIVANCVAFATEATTRADTSDTVVETRPEKPAKGEAPAKPEKPAKDEAPAEAPAKPEKPAKDETPAEVPEKPEKPAEEEAPVEFPEKPEAPAKPEAEDTTTEETTDETVTEDAATDSEESEEEETTEEEQPEKKPMGRKEFREKKEEMRKEKPENEEYVKELKGMFKHCDKEARDELLDEMAETKKADKDDSVDAFIDGEAVDFEKYDNVKPIIHKGRALVPVRAISEAYDAIVEWDEETQTVTITKDEIVVVLQIGSLVATVNGEEVELEVAPEIHKGRTLVPIRFVAEAFELEVDWDNDSRTIIVE